MKIGWIGTGVMGVSMAGHLRAAGHQLIVHNRTRAKAQPLLDSGAAWADSPARAAAGVDVLCLMVGFPSDVEAVVLGPDGALAAMPDGSLLIDFTTSRPDLAVTIAQAGAAHGILALDAPVSGGDVGAREARLSIMVGGEAEAFERARPLLECLGKTVVHQGGAGCGQHTKMVNQILVAASMVGVCEALTYARGSGLDPSVVLESVSGGAAASWTLANLYPRLLKDDLQPGFYIEHFIKDMRIALDEAARLGIDLPGLALTHQLYEGVAAGGGSRLGTQALIRAFGPPRGDG